MGKQAIYGVDPGKEYMFVPEECRDLPFNDKGRPRFIIHGLEPADAQELDDLLMVSEGQTKGQRQKKKNKQKDTAWRLGTVVLKSLDLGLVRWENMNDPQGNPIAWNDNDRMAMYRRIPESVRGEISVAIRDISDLDEDEIKNFGSGQLSKPDSIKDSDA